MATTYTEADFDDLSWHDGSIRAIGLPMGVGEPAFEPADLALDIDFIVWLCGVGARGRFRVAPAAMVFHNVTDVRIEVGTTDSGDYRMAVSPWPILRIPSKPIERPEGYYGPPSYAWTLFGASEFTLELPGRARLIEEQSLTIAERERRAFCEELFGAVRAVPGRSFGSDHEPEAALSISAVTDPQ